MVKDRLLELQAQIDLLRSIIKRIAKLIRRIQHFQSLILTSQFDAQTNEELKKTINVIKSIRNDLKMKIEEMKQTQVIPLNNKTKTFLTIQELQIQMLIDYFLDTMNLHKKAMITYYEQRKQWIIDRFEINKNEDEIDEILYQNNSIVSIIEVMTEKQPDKHSFNDLKVYYQDIIKIEKIMQQLLELLFQNYSIFIESSDYPVWETQIEYLH